jgi:hypothetical protein
LKKIKNALFLACSETVPDAAAQLNSLIAKALAYAGGVLSGYGTGTVRLDGAET